MERTNWFFGLTQARGTKSDVVTNIFGQCDVDMNQLTMYFITQTFETAGPK